MTTLPDSQLRLAWYRQSWRVWEGAAVFFEPLSGDTHRIDPPGGSILALLAESENSRAGIRSALESVAGAEMIDEALDLLLTMELVEPV